MNWKQLTDLIQIESIDEQSITKSVLIFKHSTRCSISSAALNRIERNWKEEYNDNLDVYYLDLLQYRGLSNFIAEHYKIIHQSPQALIIKGGKCVFYQTHSEINLNDLLAV